MAPVKVAGGQAIWTRDSVHSALRDYYELYGELTAACFSTSSAKWGDRPELVDRYYKGNPRQGDRAWPSLNAIKKHYDGSFTNARVALGLPPSSPGPRRKAGAHRPVRDVRERVHRVVVERMADNRLATAQRVEKAKVVVERVEVPAPGDARLRKQVTRAEARLATATERLREARERLRTARAVAAEANRTRTAVERRVGALERQLVAARDRAGERERTDERVERERARGVAAAAAERGVAEGLRVQLAAAEARAETLMAELEMADPAVLAAAREEVEGARAKVAAAGEARREAERREGAAARAARAADARAGKAEAAAANAEGERVRVQRAMVGHTRPLTPSEVEELREQGPQGPLVFMDAVKLVVRAQAKGERAALRAALRKAAAAAVSWGDRL